MKSKVQHLHYRRVLGWVRNHRRELLIGLGIAIGVLILVQLLFPSDRLLGSTKVDNQSFGWWTKDEVSKRLDEQYQKKPVELYFGSNTKASYSLVPGDVGLKTVNQERIDDVSYPWYIRLVPTSIFWYGNLAAIPEPSYNRDNAKLKTYIEQKLGASCDVAPVNASIEVKDTKLQLVPSSKGGTCELSDVEKALVGVKPKLPETSRATVAMDEIDPAVTDSTAKELMSKLQAKLDGTISIKAGNEAVVVAGSDVASWLDFAVAEDQLVPSINTDRSSKILSETVAPKVTTAAGVTKVTTVDFAEVSRVNGAKGQALNLAGTGASIVQHLLGESQEIVAAVQPVEPRVEFTRSYSPTDAGLSALMANYAKDNPGTYGVQLIELSGNRRRAAYNESKQFVAASTYKLFVAYGTLKKIESGEWRWTDQVAGGRDMAACFDDMIVKSDNPCAEELLKRYGYSNLTRDVRALGLSAASGFIGDGPKTTAGDLGLFMAMLESGQMPIQPASRDRFIGALKRNTYRQGIPAGASGQVADKVGFLNGLFHDSSIVYSPSGTYVLVVMTEGAAWSNIADLTKQIEALRAQ